MKPYDYFGTVKGQLYLRSKRLISRQYFTVLQEPKSKKGLSEDAKTQFQREILNQMRTKRRRAFRSPLIMEISFLSHDSNNTPSLHTLAKNYLDLLGKPTAHPYRRRNILFKDDGLIDILIVDHRFGSEWGDASIRIATDRISHFHHDLRLVRRVEQSEFDDAHYSFELPRMIFAESLNDSYSNSLEELGSLLSELSNLEKKRESYVKLIGAEGYEGMIDHLMRRYQEARLIASERTIYECMSSDEMGILRYGIKGECRSQEAWG